MSANLLLSLTATWHHTTVLCPTTYRPFNDASYRAAKYHSTKNHHTQTTYIEPFVYAFYTPATEISYSSIRQPIVVLFDTRTPCPTNEPPLVLMSSSVAPDDRGASRPHSGILTPSSDGSLNYAGSTAAASPVTRVKRRSDPAMERLLKPSIAVKVSSCSPYSLHEQTL